MTISDVLRAIKKHWIVEIVLFCVVAGVVAGLTFTATPVYTANTEILAQYNSSSSTGDSSTTNQQQYSNGNSPVSLYPDLVKSDEILQSVIDNLGLHNTTTGLRSRVSAVVNDSSSIVYIYATDSNPKQTVRIVKEVVKQLKKNFHSSKLSEVEIDMLLKEYFSTHQMMQRRDFQSLCGMVRSTAMIHIRRICQEGKLQNLGLRNQPIYVPVPGFYGTSRDQPTLR